MTDYLIKATAANAQIRAFAVTARDTVEAARTAHNTSPIMTAALGRLLSAGAMMGSMMKGEKDLLTLQIRGDGPGRGLTVTADAFGNVKGYPLEPNVILPANEARHLNVGGAMGNGMLSVIKDLGLREPYVGQTNLQTGEIAEDLTYYFAASEQVPSSVGLGVLMEKNNTVRRAGGFIIQLMPFAEESVIDKLEENLTRVSSVTAMLDQGMTPEMMLEEVLGGMDVQVTETMPVQFRCNCSKSYVEKALISLGKKEIREMIEDGEPIEVNCQFCGRSYTYSVEELQEMLERAAER